MDPRDHGRSSASRPGSRPGDGRAPATSRAGSRRRRLSRSAEFERVYRHGRSKANRFLVLYAFPHASSEESAAPSPEGPDGPRLGLSVSRRVGGAVTRTRLKRVVREAFWAEAPRLPQSADYVVVARPDAGQLAEREGMEGIRTALSELAAGLGAADRPDSPPSGESSA